MQIHPILKRVVSPRDLASAIEMAAVNANSLGVKYDKYISRVISVIKNNYPPSTSFSDNELRIIVEVADAIGQGSRGVMKRLKASCTGCGWCCSKTDRIVLNEVDATRISRILKRKREELFVIDGGEWIIKTVHPCLWWNPRNGRCTIYNDRPQTCRMWPLGINDEGINTVIPQSECNYAVMVLAHKSIGLLEAAGADA
jgi:hypothetical protein